MPSFDRWFQSATGNAPFPYQRRFAEAKEIPELVDVPTCLRATHRQAGLGKTAMAVLGWLWRRLPFDFVAEIKPYGAEKRATSAVGKGAGDGA